MDAVYHEKPSVTLERLSRLEQVMLDEIIELQQAISSKIKRRECYHGKGN
jgi:hypothetical protein